MVLGLDSTLAVYLVLDAFPVKTFLDLLHGSQVQDGAISHDHDLLGSHVLKVHANLLGTTRSKTNARCCHLESILFLLRVVDRCRESTSSLGDTQRIMVVSWVAVAWASWTVCAHCTQKVESSYCSAWCYAYGCHCDRYGSRKKMQREEPRTSGGYVLTCIIGSWLWGQRVLRGSDSLRGLNRFGIPLSRLCLSGQVELIILEPSRNRQRKLYECHDQTMSLTCYITLVVVHPTFAAPKQKPRHTPQYSDLHPETSSCKLNLNCDIGGTSICLSPNSTSTYEYSATL